MDVDALIAEYLGRLRAAAWPLPAARRTELEAEVSEHIEAALEAEGGRSEVAVRNVLERLGAPEDIVSAEVDADSGVRPAQASYGPSADVGVASPPGGVPVAGSNAAVPAVGPASQSVWGPIEIAAVLLLTVGSIALPFFGTLIGIVLVWASDRWQRHEKLIATAIVAVFAILPILLLLAVRVDTAAFGPIVAPVETVPVP